MKNLIVLLLALQLSYSANAQEKENKIYLGSAIATIKADKIDDFKKAVLKILEKTRAEKGNISYECYQIFDKEKKELTNRFEFREVWVSEGALMKDHMESDHMVEFFKKVDNKDKENSFFEKLELGGDWAVKLEVEEKKK
jgi:quinol monooxygenase YgiN